MNPAEPQPRRWFRRTALALTLAMAAVGAFLLATADVSWITVKAGCGIGEPDMNWPGGPRQSTYHFADLWAVVPAGREALAEEALRQAQDELRRLLNAVNPHIPGSDMERPNRARAGERVLLSEEVVEMLRIGLGQETARRKLAPRDNTPYSGDKGIPWSSGPPDPDYDQLELGENYAIKKADNLFLPLERIDYVYAIDKALARMESMGVDGGAIRIGNETRHFGRPAE